MASSLRPRPTKLCLRLPTRRYPRHLRTLRIIAYKTKPIPLQVSIRQACSQDFWAAAEVHASAFHSDKSPVSYNIAKITRFNDIVRSNHLRFGTDVLLGWEKRYICLVAERMADDDQSPSIRPSNSPLVTAFLRSVYPPECCIGLDEDPYVRGIYGALNIDTTGRFIPVVSISNSTDQKQRRRPQGCAYFSNLSVLPCVRRRGVGKSLIREAERIAMESGCWGAGLHCSSENTAAYRLYTKQGYTAISGAPVDKNDCVFLAKVFNT